MWPSLCIPTTNQSHPEQLCAPEPLVCSQLPTSVHWRLHMPELHVCSNDAAASPVPVHDPLPQICLHAESS
jgi:hypothetical protein